MKVCAGNNITQRGMEFSACMLDKASLGTGMGDKQINGSLISHRATMAKDVCFQLIELLSAYSIKIM